MAYDVESNDTQLLGLAVKSDFGGATLIDNGSRVADVVYKNTRRRPILLLIGGVGTPNAVFTLNLTMGPEAGLLQTVAFIDIQAAATGGNAHSANLMAFVPASWFYSATVVSGTLADWREVVL